MTTTTLEIEGLYEQHIKARSRHERLILLDLLTEGLAKFHEPGPDGKYSVLDFAGRGSDHPIGMDAQEYVNALRNEWDQR